MRAVFSSRSGFGDVTSTITDAAVASLTPAVEQVITDKVMPMMIVGMVAGAAVAAMIGTWFGGRIIRTHGGIRRNPVARTAVGLRHRRRRA